MKAGDRTTIVLIWSGQGERFALKRSNLKGPLHTAVHLFMRSRARWSWRNAAMLRAAGLHTPRPLALVEARFRPLRLHSFLLTEWVEGEPLSSWIQSHRELTARHHIVQKIADLWQRMGELRIAHGDMKATNFIVRPDGEIAIVDLDGMRRHWIAPRFWYERWQDHRRFLRNWQDQPEVQALFRDALNTSGPRGE